MINKKCQVNEFRRHFYRSHLSPKSGGVYSPILVDASYHDPAPRILLMALRTPQKRERIVVSTIALDWEFHEELLTNIITYITEGSPRVAFIKKPNSHDGDYEFLISSTELSKTPHIIFSDPSAISEKLANILTTYIFSRGWTETDITAFLKSDLFKQKEGHRSIYRRIYCFQQLGEFLFLNQHSTFSTLDLIIDQSIAWLSSQFNGRMWQGSFWITHDILAMMHANHIDCKPCIAPLLADIRGHFAQGSYDGVMGATCGLLVMILELQKRYPDICSSNGFGPSSIKEISSWILTNYKTQSTNDKAIAYLALNRLLGSQSHAKVAMLSTHRSDLQQMLTDAIHGLNEVQMGSENLTEIDISRWIELCLHSKDCDPKVVSLLAELKKRQSATGEWTDVTRTAHVLVFLLENIDALMMINKGSCVAPCEDMIHNGIMALRSRYNEKNANWDRDMQATAKAIHAISLYNRRYKYSTQDFFTALKQDSENMESATLIGSLNHALDSLRKETNESSIIVSKLQANAHRTARMKRFELAWRLISITTLILLIGMLGYLAIYHSAIVNEMIQAIGIPGLVISVIVSLVAAWLVGKIVQRSKTDISKLESPIRRSGHDE